MFISKIYLLLLNSRNWRNIVNQLYLNKKNEGKKACSEEIASIKFYFALYKKCDLKNFILERTYKSIFSPNVGFHKFCNMVLKP